MLKTLLLIGTGSFAGGILRYLVSVCMKHLCPHTLVLGTLTANLCGCFLIGLFYGYFSRYSTFSNSWCLLLTTGFCGGFTTFSTFANESLSMLQNGNYWSFMGYVAISVIVGIAFVALGYWVIK